jgi:DNA/RNA endonuclease YhcR with UshA esterase domain
MEMTGKPVVVQGLIEEYRGRVQIMADMPMQIRGLTVRRN